MATYSEWLRSQTPERQKLSLALMEISERLGKLQRSVGEFAPETIEAKRELADHYAAVASVGTMAGGAVMGSRTVERWSLRNPADPSRPSGDYLSIGGKYVGITKDVCDITEWPRACMENPSNPAFAMRPIFCTGAEWPDDLSIPPEKPHPLLNTLTSR